MRVFLDTNILLDVIENREEFYQDSLSVLDRCDELAAETFIAWHGLATAYYILKRGRTTEEALAEVDNILNWADVAPVNKLTPYQARSLNFDDFEDAMQTAAAQECQADVIVTRNVKDFSGSPIQAISPEAFLTFYGQPGQTLSEA
jgi:predicted nucleic acid-binding protein